MNTTISWAAVCAALLSLPAQAGDYAITVTTDETTRGDLQMVGSFMEAAANGAAVSKSLRRIGMAAVGELGLALQGRTDGNGNLQLDDGSLATLSADDTVSVQSGGDCGGTCPLVVFDDIRMITGQNIHYVYRPVKIVLTNSDGSLRTIRIPLSAVVW